MIPGPVVELRISGREWCSTMVLDNQRLCPLSSWKRTRTPERCALARCLISEFILLLSTPLEPLQRTTDYLLTHILTTHPFNAVNQAFIRDRARAIVKDFTMQHVRYALPATQVTLKC